MAKLKPYPLTSEFIEYLSLVTDEIIGRGYGYVLNQGNYNELHNFAKTIGNEDGVLELCIQINEETETTHFFTPGFGGPKFIADMKIEGPVEINSFRALLDSIENLIAGKAFEY